MTNRILILIDETIIPLWFFSPPSKSKDELHKIRSPSPGKYFSARDYSHCFKGWLLGHVVVIMAIASIVLFNAWNTNEDTHEEDKAEDRHWAVRRLKPVLTFSKIDSSFLNRLTHPISTK